MLCCCVPVWVWLWWLCFLGDAGVGIESFRGGAGFGHPWAGEEAVPEAASAAATRPGWGTESPPFRLRSLPEIISEHPHPKHYSCCALSHTWSNPPHTDSPLTVCLALNILICMLFLRWHAAANAYYIQHGKNQRAVFKTWSRVKSKLSRSYMQS